LWLGVAIMTKQQGVIYVPLIAAALHCGVWRPAGVPGGLPPLGVAWGVGNGPASVFRIWWAPFGCALRTFLLLCVGLAAVLLPILYWDSLRWAVAPSPWDLSVRNYGPLALAPWSEWTPRL